MINLTERYTEQVRLKAIVSGLVIEVYQYSKGYKTGWEKSSDAPKKEKGEKLGDKKCDAYRRVASQKEAGRRLRRLINANFSNQSQFITLTFRNGILTNVGDVSEANEKFRWFMKRVKRKYGKQQYIAVVEFQDKNNRGAVHYHLLMNSSFSQEEIAELWGYGFVHVKDVTQVDNIGVYLTSYMGKSLDDDRLAGLKAYQCSQGLEQPTELINDCAINVMEAYGLGHKILPTWGCDYEGEYVGQVAYASFNLARPKGSRKEGE